MHTEALTCKSTSRRKRVYHDGKRTDWSQRCQSAESSKLRSTETRTRLALRSGSMTGCIRRSNGSRLSRALCFGSAYIASGQSLAHSIPRNSPRIPRLSDNELRVPSWSLSHHKRVTRFLISEVHWNHFRSFSIGLSRASSTLQEK